MTDQQLTLILFLVAMGILPALAIYDRIVRPRTTYASPGRRVRVHNPRESADDGRKDGGGFSAPAAAGTAMATGGALTGEAFATGGAEQGAAFFTGGGIGGASFSGSSGSGSSGSDGGSGGGFSN